MVPLDRALVSSYRLSAVTMSLSAAFWPHYALHCPPAFVVVKTVYCLFTDTGSNTISILNE